MEQACLNKELPLIVSHETEQQPTEMSDDQVPEEMITPISEDAQDESKITSNAKKLDNYVATNVKNTISPSEATKLKPRATITASSIKKQFMKVRRNLDYSQVQRSIREDKRKANDTISSHDHESKAIQLNTTGTYSKTGRLKIVSPVPPIPSFLTLLPSDLLDRVLPFLSFKDILVCSEVCLSWYGIFASPEVWSRFCRNRNWMATSTFSHFTDWKQIFAMNYVLERNWNRGEFSVSRLSKQVKVSSPDTPPSRKQTEAQAAYSDVKDYHITEKYLPPHFGPIHAVCLDEDIIVTGGLDGNINVWTLEIDENTDKRSSIKYRYTVKAGSRPNEFEGSCGGTYCLALTDRNIIAGMSDGSIAVYNRFTGDLQGLLLHEHSDGVSGISAWSRKHQNFVTSGFDGFCRFYRIENFNGSTEFGISSLDTYESNEHRLLIRFLGSLKVDVLGIYCLDSFTLSNIQHFIAGGTEGNIVVFNEDMHMLQHRIKAHEDSVISLSCSRDLFATGSMDKTIKIWSLKNYNCLKVVHVANGWIKSIAFHHSLPFFMASTFDSDILIWKTNSMEWNLVKKLDASKLGDALPKYHEDDLKHDRKSERIVISTIRADKCHITATDMLGNIYILDALDKPSLMRE
ncbi:hypothetical protein MP638_003626 [Amoeboaphelidium occidentale]|nr:hypothetical protein MP638_003626 [Amoeboaphelidium occidentale]